MRILSLDLSTKCSGYAIFEDGKLIISGCLKASGQDMIKRIQKMTLGIQTILNEIEGIEKIIVEEVRPDVGYNNNTNVWKALTWLQAAVAFLIHDEFSYINIEYIYPSSWRSKIGIKTGRGIKRESLKQEDINYVKNKYNIDCGDDEADAICIGESFFIEEKTKETKYAW